MEVVVVVLLLAVGAWNCAMADVVLQGHQGDVTSSLNAFATDAHSTVVKGTQGLRALRKFPSLAVEHGPVSVVQDWSLVCVQLCGAALGGEPCAPYCASVTVPVSVQESNAKILLSPNKNVICEDLCTLKLGGSTCQCSSIGSPRSVQDRNRVCQTFCVNNMESLAGCSLCNMVQPFGQLDKGDAMSGDIRSAKDTKVAIAANAADSTTTPSATPDWDALCASLCKTGDGGSLCNCDLSPFV